MVTHEEDDKRVAVVAVDPCGSTRIRNGGGVVERGSDPWVVVGLGAWGVDNMFDDNMFGENRASGDNLVVVGDDLVCDRSDGGTLHNIIFFFRGCVCLLWYLVVVCCLAIKIPGRHTCDAAQRRRFLVGLILNRSTQSRVGPSGSEWVRVGPRGSAWVRVGLCMGVAQRACV